MKTLATLSFLLLNGLLIVSCGDHSPIVTPTVNNDGKLIAEPTSIITVQEAEDLFHNYKKERVPLIEASVNIDDQGNSISADDPSYVRATTSLSFDYKELQKYMDFIEQEAAAANTDITGLRVYFGKYANNKNDGRATVFFNPLMKYGNEGLTDDISFAIKTDGKVKKAIPVSDAFRVPNTKTNQSNLLMTMQNGIQSLAGNRGGWRPPPPLPNDPDFQWHKKVDPIYSYGRISIYNICS